MEYQPKANEKCSPFLHCQVLKVLLIKICKIHPPDFLFLVVLYQLLHQQMSFSTNFLSFIQYYLKKNIFVTNFSFLTDSLNHKWWVSYRLNDFKFTGMVYCNHPSLVIFVNDAKYIHFYSTFQLPPTLSHCKYEPFIKSIKFCLFHYKYWLKHFPTI